jgi:hypothetical protein
MHAIFRLNASLVLALAVLSGCASYRISSNVELPPESPPQQVLAPVVLAEDNLPGRKYREIGPVEVSVKKLTIFHKDPTKEQAQDALIERARAMGADAVINITYEAGIGFTTWGYMDAKGLAVKLEEQ